MTTYNFTEKREVEIKPQPLNSGGFAVYLFEKGKLKFALNHIFQTLEGTENMIKKIIDTQRINTIHWK